jgi:hypothetical protein
MEMRPNMRFSTGNVLRRPKGLRRPMHDRIPYSEEALEQDLFRVESAWEDCQSSRERDAIYGYLTAVFDLVAWWTADGREAERAQRALWLRNADPSTCTEPFAAVIRCTADPAKVDKRTRSKWSRVMRYALEYKSDSEPLDKFVKRKGGINEGASRFSRSSAGIAQKSVL